MLGERGRGLKLALQTLDVGRVSVAAQGTGIALAAYRLAAREAVRRSTFGKPLIENQGISFRLADVATELSAARMLTYEAARTYDRGESVSILGAMAKLYSSEVAHRAVDLAVQVHGGDGFCKPCPAERLYRDQRVLEIYEGASEIQRLVIGRAIANEVKAAGRVCGDGVTLLASGSEADPLIVIELEAEDDDAATGALAERLTAAFAHGARRRRRSSARTAA